MQVGAKEILYMLADEFDLKRNTTEDRLKLQKTIYLLQAYGLQVGYGFSWYRYGPYSQDLVYDAYKVLGPEEDKYASETSSLKFSTNTLEKFNKFKEICKEILNDPRQLELVASVDFVRENWVPTATKLEFINLFKKYKTSLFDQTKIDNESIGTAFDICERLRQK